jgi:hypothetical protein
LHSTADGPRGTTLRKHQRAKTREEDSNCRQLAKTSHRFPPMRFAQFAWSGLSTDFLFDFENAQHCTSVLPSVRCLNRFPSEPPSTVSIRTSTARKCPGFQLTLATPLHTPTLRTPLSSRLMHSQSVLAIPRVIRLHRRKDRCALTVAASPTANAPRNVFRGFQETRPRPRSVPR